MLQVFYLVSFLNFYIIIYNNIVFVFFYFILTTNIRTAVSHFQTVHMFLFDFMLLAINHLSIMFFTYVNAILGTVGLL